jgi:hypothetical protein
MFQALLAYHQEALNVQQLVYFVRVMSVGCYQDCSSTPTLLAANRHNTDVIYQLLFMKLLLKMIK